jgi:enoyl-CoA hydratase
MASWLLVDRRPPLATVTLNRPDARNAIDRETWQALAEAFRALSDDAQVRVVVLRGAGDRAFSAGADIGEFKAQMVSQQLARDYWRLVDGANSAVEACRKPVIGMIAGFALGAACALVAACDMRVAASNARIGVPAARIGLTLGLNDTRRLVGAVGSSLARDLLLTGRILTAEEALQAGLFNRVVAVDRLEGETNALARSMAEQAPLALRQAKANLNVVLRNPGFAGVDEVEHTVEWAGSQDFVEGIEAFFARRKPRFRGR